MDKISFYFYIFSGAVFLLLLFAIITNDHKTKQWIFAASYSSVILVVLGFFISNLPSNELYTLATAIIAPQIIQLIANLRHKPIHKSSNPFKSKPFRWAAFLILIAISSIPFFTVIDNETNIAYFFRLSSGVFLFIFFILIYIQPDQADGIRTVYEHLEEDIPSLENQGWIIVDTTNKNVEATVRHILLQIK
ncbi:MAG TPA: hypothetical protein PLQ75_09725 [Anaerolineales bacterium]|nr:hypothetical protein [Anaerolineales bacterium]HNF94913.1 hypothetical protein [Anaerolineales bacterium]